MPVAAVIKPVAKPIKGESHGSMRSGTEMRSETSPDSA